MIMTDDEICTSYRDAKTKSKQITILAQLNGCDRKKITGILATRGYELPQNVPSNRGRKAKPKPEPEKHEAEENPTGDADPAAPAHYKKGAVQCIDAIQASMTPEAFKGFLKGNVIKYVWRYEDKAGVQDLKKAQVYMGWLIQVNEKEG